MSKMTTVYHRTVQEDFIALPLSDPDNLSEYSRVTDNYERDGKTFLGGGWGLPEVWEPTADLVWVRKLTEGTEPKDRHFSSEWELLTAADFKEVYKPAPLLKRGDKVALKHSQYVAGTVLVRSPQSELSGVERWYVEWNDGWDSFRRAYSPDDLVRWETLTFEIEDAEEIKETKPELFEVLNSLRARMENPPQYPSQSDDSSKDWEVIRFSGHFVHGEVTDGNLTITIKKVRAS